MNTRTIIKISMLFSIVLMLLLLQQGQLSDDSSLVVSTPSPFEPTLSMMPTKKSPTATNNPIIPTSALVPTLPLSTETPPEIIRIPTTDKIVVFTFDGGSGTQSLQAILDTLEKHSVKGTFFLTGKWMESNQSLTQTIAQRGHEIFNHTYNHPFLTQITDDEIRHELQQTNDLLYQLTKQHSTPFFRPPYGDRNQNVLQIAWAEGYQSVYWTVDALDWKESEGITAEEVTARVFNNLSPGAIYLMHIGDTITGSILDEVFTYINNQGYIIQSLTEALNETPPIVQLDIDGDMGYTMGQDE